MDEFLCAICQQALLPSEEIGQLPCPANHLFHHPCIIAWTNFNSSCPLDRAEVDSMSVHQGPEGPFLKTYPIIFRKGGRARDEVEQEEAEIEAFLAELDEGTCEVCGHGDRPDRLLICDSCQLMYHLECLEAPLEDVPEGNWYCENCAHLASSFGMNVTTRLPPARDAPLTRTVQQSRIQQQHALLGGDSSGGGGGGSASAPSLSLSSTRARSAVWDHEVEVARSEQRRVTGLQRFSASRAIPVSPAIQRGLREIARIRMRRRGRVSQRRGHRDGEYLDDDSDDHWSVSDTASHLDFRGSEEDRERTDPHFKFKRKKTRALQAKLEGYEVEEDGGDEGTANALEIDSRRSKRAKSTLPVDNSKLTLEELERKVMTAKGKTVPDDLLHELARKQALTAAENSGPRYVQNAEELQRIRNKKIMKALRERDPAPSPDSFATSSPILTGAAPRSSQLLIFADEESPASKASLTPTSLPPSKPRPAHSPAPLPPSAPDSLPSRTPPPRLPPPQSLPLPKGHKDKVVALVKKHLDEQYKSGWLDKEAFKAMAKAVTEDVLDPSIPWKDLPGKIREAIDRRLV